MREIIISVALILYSMSCHSADFSGIHIEHSHFFNQLPSAFRNNIDAIVSGRLHKHYYSIRVKNSNGLYIQKREFCILGACKNLATTLSCYRGHHGMVGWVLSKNRLFDYSPAMVCEKNIIVNSKYRFSVYNDCYVNRLFHGTYIHFVKIISLDAHGGNNFSIHIKEEKNYPLLDRDVTVYSRYQFRSRSCVVKKLPQLHHG